MGYQDLHRALREKLGGVTRQAISARALNLKSQHPMTTEDAVCVIAHQNGIVLDKHLEKEVVDHVRGVLQQVAPARQVVHKSGRNMTNPTAKGSDSRVVEIAREFKVTDPLLSQEKLAQAKEMAAIYPLLYLLENSMREVIDRVMTRNHGPDWWETHAPTGVKRDVAVRMSEERRNTWHQKRGARPIDYTDLNDLKPLARKVTRYIVPDLVPSIEWLEGLIDEVYKSRCVLCHMNPLDKDSIASVKLRFRHWQKQVSPKKHLL